MTESPGRGTGVGRIAADAVAAIGLKVDAVFRDANEMPREAGAPPEGRRTGGSLSRHRGRAVIIKIARDHAESDIPTRLMIDQRGGEIRDLVALLGDRVRAYACAIESRCAC